MEPCVLSTPLSFSAKTGSTGQSTAFTLNSKPPKPPRLRETSSLLLRPRLRLGRQAPLGQAWQIGRLSLHALHVTRLLWLCSHCSRKSSLDRVRCRRRRIRSCGGADIVSRKAPSSTAAKHSTYNSVFGRGFGKHVCPSRMDLGFRTPQECSPDLSRAGAECQGRCNST